MGCGASSQKVAAVWKCEHCGQPFADYNACAQHESQCSRNPAVPQQQQQQQQTQPVSPPQQPPPQQPPPQQQPVPAPQPSKIKEADSDLEQFLTGLGVRDLASAIAALQSAGIGSRADFFNLDEEMRVELDQELKSKGVTLGDRAKIKKAEQAAVPVKQGNGEIKVLSLQPGQAMQAAKSLERVFLGIGWTNRQEGSTVDVDASCVGFSVGRPVEIVSFSNLKNPNQSVAHTGDVLHGADARDAKLVDIERIYVWLSKIPDAVDCLTFVANIYSPGVDFAQLQSAYVRMVNADTNQELARMSLAGGGLKGNALVFAKLYKCGPKGPWHFHTLGMPATVPGSSTVQSMLPLLQSSGSAYVPPGAATAGGGNQIEDPGYPQPGYEPSNPAVATNGGQQQQLQAAADVQKPEKNQTPTGVYVCGALAVASVAGIAAATAVFLTTDLSPSMLVPSIFEDGVDFSNLVPTMDTLEGIGSGIADGAEGVYDWAAGVTSDIDFGSIGDTMGDAVGFVGDGLGAAGGAVVDGVGAAGDAIGDAAPGVIDTLGDAGGAVGDFAGDAAGAMGDVAGDAGGWIGDAAGDAGGWIGDAAGAVGDAAPGMVEGVGDWMGGAAGTVAEAAPGALDALGNMAGQAASAAPEILGAVGGLIGGLLGG